MNCHCNPSAKRLIIPFTPTEFLRVLFQENSGPAEEEVIVIIVEERRRVSSSSSSSSLLRNMGKK